MDHYFFLVGTEQVNVIVIVGCRFGGTYGYGYSGEIGLLVGELSPFLVGERFNVVVPSEYVGGLGLWRLDRGEGVYVGLGRFIAEKGGRESKRFSYFC